MRHRIDKKTFYIILGVAVIAAVVIGMYWNNSMYYNEMFQFGKNNQEVNMPSGKATPPPAAKINKTIATDLSYNAALATYKDRRIQFGFDFNHSCIATPSNMVFKKGTQIMLDNRTNAPLTVAIDGQSYTMGAYGFKLATLTTSAALPHTMHVDCGSGKNNASILLQP